MRPEFTPKHICQVTHRSHGAHCDHAQALGKDACLGSFTRRQQNNLFCTCVFTQKLHSDNVIGRVTSNIILLTGLRQWRTSHLLMQVTCHVLTNFLYTAIKIVFSAVRILFSTSKSSLGIMSTLSFLDSASLIFEYRPAVHSPNASSLFPIEIVKFLTTTRTDPQFLKFFPLRAESGGNALILCYSGGSVDVPVLLNRAEKLFGIPMPYDKFCESVNSQGLT
jgi:hypothetical protein